MRPKFALSGALFGLAWMTGCGIAEPTLLPPNPKQSDELIIESVELLQLESWPVQLQMEIVGTLPSACHSLDYAVILPDQDGVIEVEAQAILGVNSECSQQAQRFRKGIGLGSYTEGDFLVLLNGEAVGEIRLGSGSEAPGSQDIDGEMTRGPVYIDEAELVILESSPVQIEIVLRGALPTPCASLEFSAEAPDDQGRIYVEAFSLQDPILACVQVLEEIEERLPIGSYSEGSYSVWLNGELVGEFDV